MTYIAHYRMQGMHAAMWNARQSLSPHSTGDIRQLLYDYDLLETNVTSSPAIIRPLLYEYDLLETNVTSSPAIIRPLLYEYDLLETNVTSSPAIIRPLLYECDLLETNVTSSQAIIRPLRRDFFDVIMTCSHASARLAETLLDLIRRGYEASFLELQKVERAGRPAAAPSRASCAAAAAARPGRRLVEP